MLRIPGIPRNSIVQASYAQAPTYVPSHIKPTMYRLLHHACHAQAPIHCQGVYGRFTVPTFSSQPIPLRCPKLSSVQALKPVTHRLLQYQPHSPTYHPSPTSSLLCSGSYIKPAILRPQHMFYPTSSLSCPGPYIITPVLHQAC